MITTLRHGHATNGVTSRTYRTWCSMLARCNNPKNTSYKYYGAKGVQVVKSWFVFDNFLGDMGVRPEGKSLDRIDTSGDYTKENCRWTTQKAQCNNRANNVVLQFIGKTLTVAEWSDETGIMYDTIMKRIAMGWPVDRILTEVPRKHVRH